MSPSVRIPSGLLGSLLGLRVWGDTAPRSSREYFEPELEGTRLLSPETVEAMHTVQYDPFRGPIGPGWGGEEAGWGLTWWADTRRGDRYFAHSGSVPGYTAFLEGNRDRGVGVALLSNGHAAHLHLFRLSEWTIDRVLDALDKEAAGR